MHGVSYFASGTSQACQASNPPYPLASAPLLFVRHPGIRRRRNFELIAQSMPAFAAYFGCCTKMLMAPCNVLCEQPFFTWLFTPKRTPHQPMMAEWVGETALSFAPPIPLFPPPPPPPPPTTHTHTHTHTHERARVLILKPRSCIKDECGTFLNMQIALAQRLCVLTAQPLIVFPGKEGKMSLLAVN